MAKPSPPSWLLSEFNVPNLPFSTRLIFGTFWLEAGSGANSVIRFVARASRSFL